MSNVEQRAFAEWVALDSVERELRELGMLHSFPEDGMERYDSLMERIAPLREKIAKLKHRADSESELAAKVRKDPLFNLLNHAEEISRVEKMVATIAEHESRLNFLQNDISKKENDLMGDIRQLAPHWASQMSFEEAERHLSSAATSPVVLRQAERLRVELAQIEAEIKDIDLNLKNEKIKRQNLEEELSAMKRQESSISPSSVNAINRDIVGVREGLLRGEEIDCELNVLVSARNELLRKFGEADDGSALPEMRQMLWLSSIFAVAFGVVWFALGRPILSAAGVLFLLVPLFLLYRKAALREEERIDGIYEQEDKRDRFFDSIESRIMRLQQQRDDTDKSVAGCAKRLEISPLGKVGSIEAMSEHLESVRLRQSYHTDANQRESRLIMFINDAKTRYGAYEKGKSRTVSNAEGLLKAWAEWLEKMDFPTTIRPESFDIFILSVNAAKDKLEILNTVRREAQSERDFIKSVRDAAFALGVKLNVGEDDLPSVFKALKEAPLQKARLGDINDNAARIASEKKACDRMIAGYVVEIQELFASAGVQTENEFRELAAAWERHWTLEANRAERLEILSVLLGGRKAAEKYINEKRTKGAAFGWKK